MTPAERTLLLALFRWARDHGVINVGWRRAPVWRYRFRFGGASRVVVSHQRGFRGIAVAGAGVTHDDYRCQTIGQAVDILAALGIVPARFSTAYRAGWDAAGRVLDAPNSEIADVEYALEPRSAR